MSVNQRAVAILHAGVTVRYEFDKNMEAFQEFMRGAAENRFEPRFLYMALGLNYEYLAMSGQLQQMTISGGGATAQGAITPLKGTGNVFSLTPQLGTGMSFWGKPVEIVLHANAGYREYQLGGNNVKMADGTTQNISVGDQGAYIGLYGAEVRFPGREGQRNTVRIERVGVGAVGAPHNALAYITFSGNWKETNSMRIQTFITPQCSYFLNQFRAGADVHPIDLTLRANQNWVLGGGPGVRMEQNFGNQVTTTEIYGQLSANYVKGFEVDVNAGYLTENRGMVGQRLSPTPFAGINLTLEPAKWFQPSSSRKITNTVPKKEGQ